MNKYQILITLMIPILIIALLSGVISSLGIGTASASSVVTLDNVRSFAPATLPGTMSYANAGGKLIAGAENQWQEIAVPAEVVVAGVANDPYRPNMLYIGAANQTALYRTMDGGRSWLYVPLATQFQGAVTALAVDSQQRIIYAGTDSGWLFRLRDIESSIIMAGQQKVDDPILEIAADSTGAGLVFARTAWNLYQIEKSNVRWEKVDTLMSLPTALAIANTHPATVYVGTTDLGLLKSEDGTAWMTANNGLGLLAGSRLQVDALAIDPSQPDVLYVATSYLYGNTQIHQSPIGISISKNQATEWSQLRSIEEIAVAQLLPIRGNSEAVYALFTNSRTPVVIGDTPQMVQNQPSQTATAWYQAFTASSMTAWSIAMTTAIVILILVALEQNARTQEGKFVTQHI